MTDRLLVLLLALAMLLGLAACAEPADAPRSAEPDTTLPDAATPPSLEPGTAPVAGPDAIPNTVTARGLYLGTAFDSAAVVVSHETIPGFMNAMRMQIRVEDRSELRGLAEGDKIRFTLADPGGDGYRIYDIETLPPDTELELVDFGADSVTPEAALSGEATDGDAVPDTTPQPLPNPDANQPSGR